MTLNDLEGHLPTAGFSTGVFRHFSVFDKISTDIACSCGPPALAELLANEVVITHITRCLGCIHCEINSGTFVFIGWRWQNCEQNVLLRDHHLKWRTFLILFSVLTIHVNMYMLRTTTKQIQQVCVDPCTSDHSIRRCPLAVALWCRRQIIDRHLPPANQLRVSAAIDRRDRQTDRRT